MCFAARIAAKSMENILKSDFQVYYRPKAQQEHITRAVTSCKKLIINSINTEVMELIPADVFTKAPCAILTGLDKVLEMNETLPHKVLKFVAKSINLSENGDVQEYFDKHRALIAQVITDNWPDINEEQTVVKLTL